MRITPVDFIYKEEGKVKPSAKRKAPDETTQRRAKKAVRKPKFY